MRHQEEELCEDGRSKGNSTWAPRGIKFTPENFSLAAVELEIC